MNAKVLDEDPDTGAMRYRYIKTGSEDHFSMAFTYAWMAAEEGFARGGLPVAILWE